MDTLWFHAPGAQCLAEIPAKALLHAKVRDVEIAKTNSVLAHSLERSPVEGGSSTSSEQPTKSPDICFAHNCSPRNQRSKQMILNSFKINLRRLYTLYFIYFRSGEGGKGGVASKGDIFQPPPLWHRPLAWVDEEILLMVMVIRMTMVRMIVARGDIFLLLVVEVKDFFRSCVIL